MVKEDVLRHFRQVFTKGWRKRPQLRRHFRSIGQDQLVDRLEADFSKDEVWATIKSCDGNKALGPDGFNLVCFQNCWEVVNGKLASGVNNYFITLIPKVDCPTSISDYRPTSLIGSMYKILAKVLANRLKNVVLRVIVEAQSAFLSGRNMLDGVLIANEIVD